MLRVTHRRAGSPTSELAHTSRSVSEWKVHYSRLTGDLEITMSCIAKGRTSPAREGAIVVALTPADLEKLVERIRNGMAVPSACSQSRSDDGLCEGVY
jgi:uncharacterized protein (DUF169 family)